MRAREAADVDRLAADVRRLHAAVARWSPSRWGSRTADRRTRADVTFALILDLAELGVRAGGDAPPGARPAQLGPHALADQLAVVASELVAAPHAAQVAAEAEAAVEASRRLLLG